MNSQAPILSLDIINNVILVIIVVLFFGPLRQSPAKVVGSRAAQLSGRPFSL